MDFLKERWMREIEEEVHGDSQPVDFDNNAAADDAENEQQGEQEILVSAPEQPCSSSVSLSPDDYCSDNSWNELLPNFTTDCPTQAAYDSASNISSMCYSFDSQQALALSEIESFIKLEDFQTQYATSYQDHFIVS
jgi:hypothetical protein